MPQELLRELSEEIGFVKQDILSFSKKYPTLTLTLTYHTIPYPSLTPP